MKLFVLILILYFFTACGASSSSPSSATAASQSTLTLSPNPATVAVSGSLQLSPSGGTAPYTFTVISGGGYVSPSSGTYTTYYAPSNSVTVEVEVTDSASNIGYFQITVGSGGASLTISPTDTSVSPSGTVTFSASGGDSSYTYSVVSGGGSFSGNVYYAPSTAQTVTVDVVDNEGNSAQTYVYVSGSSSAACEGAYNVVIDGTSGTMYLVEDSNGNIGGYLYLSGYYYPMSGSCSGSSISLTNLDFGTTYTGTLSTNGSYMTISGTMTVTSGSSYGWSATQEESFSTSSITQSCEGTYSATINGLSGTIDFVGDSGGNVIGELTIETYHYVLAGTCIINGSSGTLSLVNKTTGSTYSGSVTVSGSEIYMSGTFTLSSGGTDSWSATLE